MKTRKLKYEVDESLYAEDVVPDPRDAKTPDAWVPRHPEMVRLTGIHPFNAEAPAQKLMEAGFITPTSIHYTRNHGPVPKLDWDSHKLEIVADEEDVARGFTNVSLSMDELIALPSVSVTATLTCAGNRRKEENLTDKTVGFSWNTGAVSTAQWRGVRMRDVLLKLCNLPWRSDEDEDEDDEYPLEERYLWMVGADDLPKGNYGTCIPLGLAMNLASDVILAFEVNGKPLPPDRGYPVRVVVPGWIGGRMVKWLKRLEVRKGESDSYYHYFDNRILPPGITKELADKEGWWMRKEYLFNELNINSAIVTPFHEDTMVLPKTQSENKPALTLKGYAYTGSGKRVTRVEVSFDYGHTWKLAELHVQERPSRYGMYWCWVHWSYEATAEELATPHRMMHCRAWDQSSNTQPNRLTWNVMGMGNNCIFGVRIDHRVRDDGSTELCFVHPTQEAGMSTVGWMTANHRPPAAVPPVRIPDAPGSDDTEGSSVSMGDDDEDPAQMDEEDLALLKSLPEFTLDEVARHDTEESAWIVVRDKVYDCTPFMEDHPGGPASILMAAGADATEDVEAIHSPKALGMLRDYLIGRLASAPLAKQLEQVSSEPAATPQQMQNQPWLQPKAWVDFEIVSKEDITSNTILLRFAPRHRDEKRERPLGLPVGMHVMIKSKMPDGSPVIRPYTPIVLAARSEERDEFTMLVKVYRANEHPKFPEGGKMSQVLDSLSEGSFVQVKGPCGHIQYPCAGQLRVGSKNIEIDNLGFMCGGTGITPAFRVIESGLANPDDKTVFWLIYANNSTADIALRAELDEMAAAHPDRLHVFYTVSNPPEDEVWKGGIGFINEDMVRANMPPAGARNFVGLCGPPPMIKFACIPSLEKIGYGTDRFDCF
ncbi:Nitrate reductase NADH [Hondaea fermentalgiana]|uniref:Nitrate reductase NADH n=1 Tax=Hondaea fermentalgiana TaxID=2315210 RepID=A0A2R5GTI5_9STRA|nr:Nitrate reductase NADH [Hondaea fermentalgiana]|eukprot:GBG31701.1 Nitrate reductase NADH [Hondaea fermentalgiana]